MSVEPCKLISKNGFDDWCELCGGGMRHFGHLKELALDPGPKGQRWRAALRRSTMPLVVAPNLKRGLITAHDCIHLITLTNKQVKDEQLTSEAKKFGAHDPPCGGADAKSILCKCSHTIAGPFTSLPRCCNCDHFVAKKKDERPHMTAQFHIDHKKLAPSHPGLRLNASIIDVQGGYAFAYRTSWGAANVSIVKLDKNFKQIGDPVALQLSRKGATDAGREDPRLFYHRGKLHVWYIGWQGHRKIKGNNFKANVLYARLNNTTFAVEEIFFPKLRQRNEWEKNHSYFDWHNELFCVYSIYPHKVLKISGETDLWSYETVNPIEWSGGYARGGASPVLVGKEYYHFFHGMKEVRSRRRYSVGVAVFEAKPPFRIKRLTPDPIMGGNFKLGQFTDIIFPCGAVLVGNEWIISGGIADKYSEIRAYPFDEIERTLVKV